MECGPTCNICEGCERVCMILFFLLSASAHTHRCEMTWRQGGAWLACQFPIWKHNMRGRLSIIDPTCVLTKKPWQNVPCTLLHVKKWCHVHKLHCCVVAITYTYRISGARPHFSCSLSPECVPTTPGSTIVGKTWCQWPHSCRRPRNGTAAAYTILYRPFCLQLV